MADRKTQKLLEGLQQDLERELSAMLQYLYQSSVLLGPSAVSIAPFLKHEADEELQHAAFLSDQIVNLGGLPKLTAPKISETRDLRQMLDNDLDRERECILEFRERVKQAEIMGELGLKIQLERLIEEETQQMRSLERILRGWATGPS
ncbi:MAG: ferritin-like domain-containing protein [Chloroflexi bacterium]|nr:ferritin-like domain-containing protein [Chloroflexota bacterium]